MDTAPSDNGSQESRNERPRIGRPEPPPRRGRVASPEDERGVHPERSDAVDGFERPRKAEPERRRDVTPAGLDETKVRCVREYLQHELPQCSVYDFFDFERTAYAFHLQNSQGQLVHLAFVTAEFLSERSEREIQRFLEQQRVAHLLRQAGYAGLTIGRDEVTIERR
jgi:hypothetical protein